MEQVLGVRDARKRYGTTVALSGVDVALAKGEWLGLLGPNGAGKTTLVKAIAGRVRLDGGTIEMLGMSTGDPSMAALARRRLGVVPQEIAVYPLLTARENLEVFGSLTGLTGETLRDRVAWALDFTGLADRAGDRAGGFSGGMKRRLNIACSVMHRPEVILLDEPTVGVDPQSRERIWAMLSDLRSQGASLMLTSHQLDEVERVCDRIVIIDHGRVIANGTLEHLIGQTIGRERWVTLALDRTVEVAAFARPVSQSGTSVRCAVMDVGVELPLLLERARLAGARVEDVQIAAPSLQAVFIHLTGRELRE